MVVYRRVYDSRHLQADCQEPGSAPEPYARQSSTGYLYLFYTIATNCRCAEKSYPPSFFHHRVSRYRIDDFNPPPIEMMREFCEDVDRWLSRDPRNVIAVHCQAGKVGHTKHSVSATYRTLVRVT